MMISEAELFRWFEQWRWVGDNFMKLRAIAQQLAEQLDLFCQEEHSFMVEDAMIGVRLTVTVFPYNRFYGQVTCQKEGNIQFIGALNLPTYLDWEKNFQAMVWDLNRYFASIAYMQIG